MELLEGIVEELILDLVFDGFVQFTCSELIIFSIFIHILYSREDNIVTTTLGSILNIVSLFKVL